MDKKQAEKLIDSVRWTFAKSMPGIPHEYIVVDNYPEKADDMKLFVSEIAKNGYTKTFFGKVYKYLEIGDYKYWVIDNIINRAKIEE